MSETTKHTPPPFWNDGHRVLAKARKPRTQEYPDFVIAQCSIYCGQGPGTLPEDEIQANVRLFTAAPETAARLAEVEEALEVSEASAQEWNRNWGNSTENAVQLATELSAAKDDNARLKEAKAKIVKDREEIFDERNRFAEKASALTIERNNLSAEACALQIDFDRVEDELIQENDYAKERRRVAEKTITDLKEMKIERDDLVKTIQTWKMNYTESVEDFLKIVAERDALRASNAELVNAVCEYFADPVKGAGRLHKATTNAERQSNEDKKND